MMYLCKAKMCFSMNREEFEKVSAELKRVASDMPPEWGAVQNDELDDQVDVFAFSALADLDREMDGLCLCEKDRTYVRRRWYIAHCARCDEYIFCLNDMVIHNSDIFDKSWDIRFEGVCQVAFDVKSSRIPKALIKNAAYAISNPRLMIGSFYRLQSKERRYSINNRLFVVHHSFVAQWRELILRSAWELKNVVFEEYCRRVLEGKKAFFDYEGCVCDVIVIQEDAEGNISYVIY